MKSKSKCFLAIMLLVGTLAWGRGGKPDPNPVLEIVPWPQSINMMGGDMALSTSSRIVYKDSALAPLAQVVAEEVEAVTQLSLASISGEPMAGDIYLTYTSDTGILGERYRVVVDEYATAEAANYQAVALATTTLIQSIRATDAGYRIPKLNIWDYPDVAYRGLLVDVARRYHSIDTLKDVVKMCRLYKIRYLQLHLTDDQAFTFPSQAYPVLADYGHDYSMEEMKELVTYADQRGVTIIPELEVPAHASSFTKAMPELFASPTNGIINFADPAVWDAVKTLIDEMCDVFQSTPYFHLGADEANIWGLSSDPEFQAAFNTYGVDGIEGLFNYFVNELNDKIRSRGKQAIVWEGFNYGKSGNSKMDSNIHVMMFDNYKDPQAYMNAGYRVINASWFPLYIVGGNGFGVTPDLIYDWDRFQFGNYTDPFPRRYDSLFWKNVTPTQRVPGAQMCSWEMPEDNEIPYVRFRLAPFSDRVWNEDNYYDYEHFDKRFAMTDHVLDQLLAKHQSPSQPVNLAASQGIYADKIRVAWNGSSNYPMVYALYRNTVNNASSAVCLVDDLSKSIMEFEDVEVELGQTYYYWVKAWNQWGWSEFSQVAAGTVGQDYQAMTAYEPFDYTPWSSIDNQNGGSGFAKPWSIDSVNGSVTVIPQGLTYSGLPTQGGAIRFTTVSDNPSVLLRRRFVDEIGHDMSLVWLSFLLKVEKVADGHNFFIVNKGAGSSQIGKKWGNGFGFYGHSSTKLQNGRTYFVVACYDCRAGNDHAYLWVNPSLDQPPLFESATDFYAGGDIGIGNVITMNQQGHGRGVYIYDEIRFGASWEEVVGQ